MDLCHSNKSLLNAQFLKIPFILYILNLVSCRFITLHNSQQARKRTKLYPFKNSSIMLSL